MKLPLFDLPRRGSGVQIPFPAPISKKSLSTFEPPTRGFEGDISPSWGHSPELIEGRPRGLTSWGERGIFPSEGGGGAANVSSSSRRVSSSKSILVVIRWQCQQIAVVNKPACRPPVGRHGGQVPFPAPIFSHQYGLIWQIKSL